MGSPTTACSQPATRAGAILTYVSGLTIYAVRLIVVVQR